MLTGQLSTDCYKDTKTDNTLHKSVEYGEGTVCIALTTI